MFIEHHAEGLRPDADFQAAELERIIAATRCLLPPR
jgi:hypothetical protein